FRAGQLPLTLAEKVCGLPSAVQDQLAQRIRAGEAPRAVVLGYLGKAADGRLKVDTALAHLLRALRRAQKDLGDRVEELGGGLFGPTLGELRQGRVLLDALIARLEVSREESRQALRRLSRIGRETDAGDAATAPEARCPVGW